MARQLSRRYVKTVFWILLGATILGFAGIWGVGRGWDGGQVPNAGRVFGEKISEIRFEQERQVRFVLFDIPPSDRQSIWEHLAMLHEAKAMGIMVSNTEIEQAGRAVLGLRDDADPQTYRYAIGARLRDVWGIDAYSAFVQAIREEIMVRKLQSLITSGVHASEAEALETYMRQNEKVRTRYAVFWFSDFLPFVQVSEEEAKVHFTRNLDKYREPEKARVDLVRADYQTFIDSAEVAEQEALDYYEKNKETYRIAEPLKPATDTATSPAPATDSLPISDALASDTASAAGDLAPTTDSGSQPEVAYRPFEEVAEEIREMLRTRKGREKAGELMREVSNDVNTWEMQRLISGKREPLDLEALADKWGLEYGSTDYFAAESIPAALSGFPNIREYLFEREVGFVSPILKGSSGQVVVRVLDLKPEWMPPFDEVSIRVISDVKAHKTRALALSSAEELRRMMVATSFDDGLERWKRGAAIAPATDSATSPWPLGTETESYAAGGGMAAATESGSAAPKSETAVESRPAIPRVEPSVGESGFFGQRDANIPKIGAAPAVRRAALRLRGPTISPPIEEADGYYILQIAERQAADPAGFEAQKDIFLASLRFMKRREILEAWRANLLERARIEDRHAQPPAPASSES